MADKLQSPSRSKSDERRRLPRHHVEQDDQSQGPLHPQARKRSPSPDQVSELADKRRRLDSNEERNRSPSPRREIDREDDRKRKRSPSPRQGERQVRRYSRSPRRNQDFQDFQYRREKRTDTKERKRSRSPRYHNRENSCRMRGGESERGSTRDYRDRDHNMDSGRGRDDPTAEGFSDMKDSRREDGPGYRNIKQDSSRRGRDRNDRDFEKQYRDREDKSRAKKLGGFSYKDKRRDYQRDDRDGDRRGGSFRGYRDRSASPRRQDRDTSYKSKTFDTSKPPKRAAAVPTKSAHGGYIKVIVNNRLGTKTEVPCSPDDTIEMFKKFLSAFIGQPVGRIRLQRQGQKPFRNEMSLWDYEIGHGSSIDLEIGTSDD